MFTKVKWRGLLIFVFSVVSCARYSQNQSNKTIVFNIIKKIEIPIPDSIDNFVPQSMEYTDIENKPTLVIQYNGYSSLFFYDLSQKKIYHTINIKHSEIEQFHVFSKDSILLYVSNIDFNNNFYDSVLCFVDYSGQHYHYLNINKNPYLWTSAFKDSSNIALAPYLNFNNFTIQNTSVFFPYEQFDNKGNLIDDALNNKHFPLFGMFNLKNEQWYINKSFQYPDLAKGHYYPDNYLLIRSCLNNRNFPVFQFGYSLNLYEWDTQHNKVITHQVTSQLIDSIQYLKAPNPLIDMTNAKVSELYFDPFHKWYYSFIQLSEAYKYTLVLLVLDDHFNVIAEAMNPKINNDPIFKDDTIISWGYKYKNPDFLNIYFEIQALKPANLDTIKYALNQKYDAGLDVLKQEGTCKLPQNDTVALVKENRTQIRNVFFNQFHILDSSFVLVHVFSDDGCYHCYEKVLNFFSVNYDYLKTKSCYLMVSGKNKEQMKLKLKFKDLLKFKNLIADTNNLYSKQIHSVDKNPRIFIVRNSSLTFDTIYPATQTDSIFYRILNIF